MHPARMAAMGSTGSSSDCHYRLKRAKSLLEHVISNTAIPKLHSHHIISINNADGQTQHADEINLSHFLVFQPHIFADTEHKGPHFDSMPKLCILSQKSLAFTHHLYLSCCCNRLRCGCSEFSPAEVRINVHTYSTIFPRFVCSADV